MTYQDFNSFRELNKELAIRVGEIVNKIAKEIDENWIIKYATNYVSELVRIETDSDGISVWKHDGDIVGFYYEPNGDDDFPIECLYDEESLDKYIEKYKQHKIDREKKEDELEYEEYLKLKAKYEGK